MIESSVGMVSLFGHVPATYRNHPVHASGRTYQETNCYTDILIELLHARGDEPLAALGATVRLDFEGDQWTFIKPAPGDLEVLFGVDIHEMQPYRPLPAQITELIAAGRTMTVELDAWFLPDTAATSYRNEHVKTSVAIEAIDPTGQRLRYYHNASLFELGPEDYRGIFRLGVSPSEAILPPYTELVRFDGSPRLGAEDLRATSLQMLRYHLARRPAVNPFYKFGDRLVADLPALLEGSPAEYHAYAFATVRMAGAGFELCATHVDWLLGNDGARASASMAQIAEGCKILGFKLARRREFDPRPAVEALGSDWSDAMAALEDAIR